MVSARFNQARSRLDRLKRGERGELDLFGRARALLFRDDGLVDTSGLRALDRDLERAGVHTSADARLLRELSQARGRVGDLSQGLLLRAEGALHQFELALAEAERLAAADGAAATGLVRELEADFRRLSRIVKVAAIFGSPGGRDVELLLAGRSDRGGPPASARLAVAEFLEARARNNVDDTAQKRRDLDRAYELLLRMSAEATEERDRVRQGRIEIAAARERAQAAPVVHSLPDLLRHLRHTARKEPATAYRSLRSLYERAVEAGDEALTAVAGAALEAVVPRGAPLEQAVARTDALRAAGVRANVRVDGSHHLAPGGKKDQSDGVEDLLAQLAFDLTADQQQVLDLASGCSRFFDVEDALSEVYDEADLGPTRPRQRRVPWPTQQMSFEHTNRVDEIHNLVISNPSSLVLDLASGRQLVRSYVEEEPPSKPRNLKQTAVRVYVLDASGSMHGARARFRDAILIAELNAVRVRSRLGLAFDPLYFSFFNDAPSDLLRVESAQDANRHIQKLFANSPAEGQTDITLALMSAFDSIGKARGKDPYLARATVVLVTDGEDGVDLELIRRTQQPYEGLQIALSFISLGEENADLKSLVLSQRKAGARAFYHRLSDAEIELSRSEFDSGFRTLAPQDVAVGPELLERLLPHLEALDAIAQGRPARASERADLQFEALFPPELEAGRGGPQDARIADLLEAVAEAASLANAEVRSGEAVTLLLHLLELYDLGVPGYLSALKQASQPVVEAIASLRRTCSPFGA